jgi:ERCC4-type nuclease
MIVIDSREHSQHPEFQSIIRRKGVLCDVSQLGFADFAFEGKGPEGSIAIGVERKALHDMLSCIDDSRYSAHQRVGMAQNYTKSFLIIEGDWKPHDTDGTLQGWHGLGSL